MSGLVYDTRRLFGSLSRRLNPSSSLIFFFLLYLFILAIYIYIIIIYIYYNKI